MSHASGVDYGNLDALKRGASAAGAATEPHAFVFNELGWEVIPFSRGESVFLVRQKFTKIILGFLVEGLGTKNLIAEFLRSIDGRTYYDVMGWDTIAMIVNDAVSLGALPILLAQHPALAEGDHLSGQKGEDLIRGTVEACEFSGAVYGPGETPGLAGIIVPGTMCLSGAGLAQVPGEEFLMHPDSVRPGMKIVMLGSSGIHANGISAIRKAIHKWPEGYKTPVGGSTFGELLLQKTQIYVPFIRECQVRGVKLHYSSHISGHGWAKVLRSKKEVRYRIKAVPNPQPVFGAIQSLLGYSPRQMYGAYNMGCGFCLFVDDFSVPKLKEIGKQHGIPVYDVGVIERGPRSVIIEPLKIEFGSQDVDIR